jgi:hypothetical protein
MTFGPRELLAALRRLVFRRGIDLEAYGTLTDRLGRTLMPLRLQPFCALRARRRESATPRRAHLPRLALARELAQVRSSALDLSEGMLKP